MVLTCISASTEDDDEESVDTYFNLSDFDKEGKADNLFFEAEEECDSDITSTELQDFEADAIMPPMSARKNLSLS